MTCGTDYEAFGHKHPDVQIIGSFFGAGGFRQAHFPNQQTFDFEGLEGRLLSSSYAPEPGHPKHHPMLAALNAIFNEYETDGEVTFEYDTTVYYGKLTA